MVHNIMSSLENNEMQQPSVEDENDSHDVADVFIMNCDVLKSENLDESF